MAATETEWRTAPPCEQLRRFVDQYVGYRLTGCTPGVHRGLPSRHLTFIVGIGEEIDVVAHTDPRQEAAGYRAVVSGLQTTPALIAYGHVQEGVAVELSPLGARALLALPAGAIWNTTLELSELVGPIGVELWERLQATAGWQERFALCDEMLTRLLQPTFVEPPLELAWQLAVGGAFAVGQIAKRVGWSRQHLTQRFRSEFGVAPKIAGRIARFERARRVLDRPDLGSFAQVAALCGYYDQAHMNRDFAAFAGCSPSRLLADELPSFQDEGVEGVAAFAHEHQQRDVAHPLLS